MFILLFDDNPADILSKIPRFEAIPNYREHMEREKEREANPPKKDPLWDWDPKDFEEESEESDPQVVYVAAFEMFLSRVFLSCMREFFILFGHFYVIGIDCSYCIQRLGTTGQNRRRRTTRKYNAH
jgi:hypothetical protein